MTVRTYSELIALPTFEERYRYLALKGVVGKQTFGFERYLNQSFYHDPNLWKKVRRQIIIRDNGCDLAIPDREITGRIYVHHLNPISVNDIRFNTDYLLNPEYLICTSFNTHNAIHYGSEDLLATDPIVRSKNDTCPWKKVGD